MADMRANGSSAMNDWLASSLSHVASLSSSDRSAQNPHGDGIKATAPISNTADRNVGDRFELGNGSNVPSRSDETDASNGNHSDYTMVENTAAIDAAIDLAPHSHMDNLCAPQPVPANFGNSTSPFSLSSGYSVDGNSKGFTRLGSPMLFVSSPFPRRDNGNLLRHGSSVGYSTIPSNSSQAPVANTSIPASRAEITPQVLLSLEDALNRAASAEPLQLIQEEGDNEPKNDTAESSTFNEKTVANKRHKNKVRRVSLSIFHTFSLRHRFFLTLVPLRIKLLLRFLQTRSDAFVRNVTVKALSEVVSDRNSVRKSSSAMFTTCV